MKKNAMKKVSVPLTAALALMLVVGAWAYYSNSATINNQLETGITSDISWEKFDPPPHFEPGDKIGKEVFVQNTGETNLVARVSMQEVWELHGGGTLQTIASTATDFNIANANTGDQLVPTDGLTDGDGSVVYKELNLTDWTFDPSDGYWYYNKILSPAGTSGGLDVTAPLLKSVTLAKDADMGVYTSRYYYTSLTTMPNFLPASITGNHTSGWQEYAVDDDTVPVPAAARFTHVNTSPDLSTPGYADAKYSLSIQIETLQATSAALDDVWGSGTILDTLRGTWGI